jgi:hypothetical protein
MGPIESAARGANSELNSQHANLQRLAREWRIIITTEHRTIGKPGMGESFQHGGVVPGPIGAPRRATVHGGEIILNPYQPGALGGPPVTNNNQRFNETFNIYNPLAGAMAMAQRRQRRRQRFEARM